MASPADAGAASWRDARVPNSRALGRRHDGDAPGSAAAPPHRHLAFLHDCRPSRRRHPHHSRPRGARHWRDGGVRVGRRRRRGGRRAPR